MKTRNNMKYVHEKFLLWGNKEEKRPPLTLESAYKGVVKILKTIKTTIGQVYEAGKHLFIVKKPNDPNVAIYRDAKRVGQDKPHMMRFERLQPYIELLGMKGLNKVGNEYGRFQFEENLFDQDRKMGTSPKGTASKRVLAPKRTKKGEMVKIEEKIEGFLQGKNKPKKGAFHRWLGKAEDSPITAADIAKGLASKDPHVRKMANFAKNARKWKH